MTPAEWEDFIHSAEAVGAKVRIVVPREERAFWPVAKGIKRELRRIRPGSHVVEFDASIGDGVVGTVIEESNCGWLKIEIPDYGIAPVPGWYLQPEKRLRG